MHDKLLLRIDRILLITKLDGLVKIIPLILATIAGVLFPCIVGLMVAWAGPPFVTDDPEPIEYRHWEIYLNVA